VPPIAGDDPHLSATEALGRTELSKCGAGFVKESRRLRAARAVRRGREDLRQDRGHAQGIREQTPERRRVARVLFRIDGDSDAAAHVVGDYRSSFARLGHM